MTQKRGGKNKDEPNDIGKAKPPKILLSASARLDSEGAIGTGLRSLYQQVVKEPLPDDILALLDKLGSADSKDG